MDSSTSRGSHGQATIARRRQVALDARDPTYYLVLSTFTPGITGTFTIDFTSATVHVVPVELQAITVE